MKTVSPTISVLLRPWPSVVALAAAIFVGSTIPMPEGPTVDLPVGPDKIVHVAAYALLAALTVRAAVRRGRRMLRAAAAVSGAIAYGGLLEGWQALLGGRGSELGDAVANAIGAVIGGLVALWACRAVRVGTANSMERPDHDKAGRAQAG